jgi:hypothetical protein
MATEVALLEQGEYMLLETDYFPRINGRWLVSRRRFLSASENVPLFAIENPNVPAFGAPLYPKSLQVLSQLSFLDLHGLPKLIRKVTPNSLGKFLVRCCFPFLFVFVFVVLVLVLVLVTSIYCFPQVCVWVGAFRIGEAVHLNFPGPWTKLPLKSPDNSVTAVFSPNESLARTATASIGITRKFAFIP